MSDTTPDERNTTPETDASAASTGRHETDPIDLDAPAEAAAQAAHPVPLIEPPAPEAAQPVSEPVGEPISYDTPTTARDSGPIPGDTGGHDSYLPAATVAGAAAGAGASARDSELAKQPSPQPEQQLAQQPTTDYTPGYTPTAAATAAAAVPQPPQGPIYIQAPAPPVAKGNRGTGVLLALLATAVYAAVYAAVAFGIAGAGSGSLADAAAKFTEFVVLPVYYVPVIFFFIALALLVLLVNRGGWWAYVLFGFLVAVVVYFSYIGGALLTVQAWNFTPAEAARFIASQWLNPGAIAAAVVAREVPIWAGAWIARNGRSVTARNAAAKQDYERRLAEGPQLARQE